MNIRGTVAADLPKHRWGIHALFTAIKHIEEHLSLALFAVKC